MGVVSYPISVCSFSLPQTEVMNGVEGWQMTSTPTNTLRHSITCMKGFVWDRGWNKLSYSIEVWWFSNWSLWWRLPAFSEAGCRGLGFKSPGADCTSSTFICKAEPAISGHTLSADSASLLQRERSKVSAVPVTHTAHTTSSWVLPLKDRKRYFGEYFILPANETRPFLTLWERSPACGWPLVL